MSSEIPYLSVCTTYCNHASYLREWVEFHRLVGVERFFFYDNGSTDDHLEVLAPYFEQGIGVLHDWPGTGVQFAAIDHCLETHRHDSRWIAFIDIDEFLFSPTGQKVSEVLVDYEDWPGVGINVVVFGTSGHKTRPPGLVIENYVRSREPAANTKKCVVDPARTPRCRGPHLYEHLDGHGVDENKQPALTTYTDTFSVSRLRINHYYTKSEEELEAKFALLRADNGELREPLPRAELERLSSVPDETLLGYAPAVKEALERLELVQTQG